MNAASASLRMSTGVGGAIERVGGDAIQFAAMRQAPVPLGGAAACRAFGVAIAATADVPASRVTMNGAIA